MTNQNMSAERGSFNEQPEVKSQKGKPGWMKKIIRGGAAMLTILGAAEGSAMAKDPGDYPEIGHRPSVDQLNQVDHSVENEIPFTGEGRIIWDNVNVRKGPGIEYEDIGDLVKGDSVTFVGLFTPENNSTWFHIKEGWIIGDSVEPVPESGTEPAQTDAEPVVVAQAPVQGPEQGPVRPPEPPTAVTEAPTEVPEGMIGFGPDYPQIPNHPEIQLIATALKDDNEYLKPLFGTETFTPFNADFSLGETGITLSPDGKHLYVKVALTSECKLIPMSVPSSYSGVCVGMYEVGSGDEKVQKMIVFPLSVDTTGNAMELMLPGQSRPEVSNASTVIDHLQEARRGDIVTFDMSANFTGATGTYYQGILDRVAAVATAPAPVNVPSYVDDKQLESLMSRETRETLQIGTIAPFGVAIGVDYPQQ